MSGTTMSQPAMLGFNLLALAIILEVLGQLLFKAGVAVDANAATRLRSWRVAPWVWIAAGIVAYMVELVVWVAALSSLALSKAFPLLSLSYAGVAVGAWVLFDERLGPRAMAGIALLTAGAALMIA